MFMARGRLFRGRSFYIEVRDFEGRASNGVGESVAENNDTTQAVILPASITDIWRIADARGTSGSCAIGALGQVIGCGRGMNPCGAR